MNRLCVLLVFVLGCESAVRRPWDISNDQLLSRATNGDAAARSQVEGILAGHSGPVAARRLLGVMRSSDPWLCSILETRLSSPIDVGASVLDALWRSCPREVVDVSRRALSRDDVASPLRTLVATRLSIHGHHNVPLVAEMLERECETTAFADWGIILDSDRSENGKMIPQVAHVCTMGAARAVGLRPADELVELNGESAHGLGVVAVLNHATDVLFSVRRGEAAEIQTFRVTRDPTADTEVARGSSAADSK